MYRKTLFVVKIVSILTMSTSCISIFPELSADSTPSSYFGRNRSLPIHYLANNQMNVVATTLIYPNYWTEGYRSQLLTSPQHEYVMLGDKTPPSTDPQKQLIPNMRMTCEKVITSFQTYFSRRGIYVPDTVCVNGHFQLSIKLRDWALRRVWEKLDIHVIITHEDGELVGVHCIIDGDYATIWSDAPPDDGWFKDMDSQYKGNLEIKTKELLAEVTKIISLM